MVPRDNPILPRVWWLPLLLAIMVATPAQWASPSIAKGGTSYIHHRVKRGETLYRIAKKYGVSVKAVMRANNIRDPKKVRVGTVLLIPKRSTSHSSAPNRPHYPKNYSKSHHYWSRRGTPRFAFPGKVLDQRSGVNHGLDLKVAGGIVRAAGDGKIIYRTTSMLGYSSVLIIEHGGGFETVYAGKDVEWSKEKGQWVMRGEIIGRVMGTAKEKYPLHFEIRKKGQPLPAMKYLR